MLKSTFILVAAGAAGLMLASGATPSNAAYYDGKTITVLVGASAGGGLTRAARVYAKHMKIQVAGKPNMIIKNLTGAGGNKARNYLNNKAKRDGLTIYWGPANQLGALLKLKGVRYDPSKFILIGAGDSSYLTLARTDTGKGLKTAADLMNAGGIVVGGRAPTSQLDLYARAPLHILGLKHRYVPGYRGQAKLNPAIRANEINYLTTGNGGYVGFYKNTILKTGEAIGLYYHTAIDKNGKAGRLPGRYGKTQHFLDYYKNVTGKVPSGPAWEAYKWMSTYLIWPFLMYTPPGVPDEAIAALRKGFVATAKDAAFRAEYAKSVGPVPNFVNGKDAGWLLSQYKNISPAALKGLERLTARPGGSKIRKKRKK